MKRLNTSRNGLLVFSLMFGMLLALGGAVKPAKAQAALRVQATVNVAPVKALVVIGSGPRVGVIPKPVERRVVVRERCGCDRNRHQGRDRVVVRHRHHHHDRGQRIWVKGHWIKVSARVSRWVPGHWARPMHR